MPEHDDLTPGEVASLTQKKRADQQAAVLAKMGVPFRFGGGIVSVRRAVAQELPQWLAKMNTARPRLDLIR